jgi:hypothetical protein
VVRELSPPQAGKTGTRSSGIVKRCAEYVREDQACSACYANLIYALSRMDNGELRRLPEKVCIGQGFAGKSGSIGVGRCASGFTAAVKGCPPSGADMLEFLRQTRI